jgi:hypothetical protein
MPSKSPSNRKFGLTFAAVSLIFAVIAHFPSPAFYVFGTLTIVFLAVSLLVPRLLAPLKRLWLGCGLRLNRIVGPIILSLVYLFAIIPVGALIRLFGKDLLSLKHHSSASSYWVRRKSGGATAESLKDQF